MMIDNAYKESCHNLFSSILVREHGLYVIKTNCSGKVVVAFTIKEKLFNGKPISPIGAAAFLFVFVVISS